MFKGKGTMWPAANNCTAYSLMQAINLHHAEEIGE